MQIISERDFGDVILQDLAAARGGTVFVRQVPRDPASGSQASAGELLALDATLTERDRLDVEALVVKHHIDERLGIRALRTVHDPRGWAFSIVCFDRIAGFGFGTDEAGQSRTGEAWASYGCERAKLFSSAHYHPTNGDLVFVEEGAAVRTAHAHLEWDGVAAYGAVMDDHLIAAIGPKFLYVYDRAAGTEAFRAPVGPGFSVGLLPDRRVVVLGGKKARLRVFDAAGTEQLCLVSGMPVTARIAVSSGGRLALVMEDRLAFVDPATSRVAFAPSFVGTMDDPARRGQFAWLDDERAAVVWPGTAKLSVLAVGDVFATFPDAHWKAEKPKTKR